MPEKVLGLDIGPITIKAVLLERRGKQGGRILACDAINIDECGGREAALKKLAADLHPANVSCFASLPLQEIMFRQVTLPFREENKIRKTLPFELEPLLPFAVDEIAADYLSSSETGFLVAVTTKKNIREWIALIEGSLGEVPVLDVSTAPLASLLPEKTAAAASGMLVDIGSISTTVDFYENGAIVQIRSLAFGGDRITEALAHDFALSKEEARQKEISVDYGSAGIQTKAVCRQFCRDLENTIEFLLLNETLQKYPQKIILTGGGSLNASVKKELESCFSLPVEMLNLRQLRQIQIDDGILNHYNPQIMDGALAVALRPAAGGRSFNFRQGEFKPGTRGDRLQGLLAWAAPVAGLIIALAAGNQYLDYRLQAQRLDGIKKQISFLFKKDYPEATAMVDPLQQLKTKLAANKKSFGFYEGGPEVTVLDLLKDISGFILPSLDVIVSGFSYENDVVLIKGEAKDIDAVSAVKSELMKSKYFKEVLIGSTNLARQGGKVDFDLRITLK
jgi:Tfp pilus assembly PilM family ATPase